MRRGLQSVAILTAGLLVSGFTGSATPASDFDAAWSLCADATHRVERERGIPKDLLTAISLAESGRWDSTNGETHAWPWTVTSGENTWQVDSKAEAIQRVQALRGAGVSNIDVGCMQINLRYHPDAFASIEQAFDPLANARYAGNYLSDLHRANGNWLTAAGNYHSSTQKYHERYKLKVARFWNDRRNGVETHTETASASTSTTTRQSTASAAIDYQRMAQLNRAFRARQTVAAETTSAATQRNAGSAMPLTGDRYALNAQIQRIRKQAERKNQIDELARSGKSPSTTTAGNDINPDLMLWRNLYRSGPTNGPFLGSE